MVEDTVKKIENAMPMGNIKKSKNRRKSKEKIVVGWREWVGFPDIGIEKIKAKIDTGARSSALHAWNISPFKRDGQTWVEFEVHPIQRTNQISLICAAPVLECRKIRSSSGHLEMRYVIVTTIDLGERSHPIEITLTNRDEMGFRLLLGRTALRGQYIVDPGRSFLTKK